MLTTMAQSPASYLFHIPSAKFSSKSTYVFPIPSLVHWSIFDRNGIRNPVEQEYWGRQRRWRGGIDILIKHTYYANILSHAHTNSLPHTHTNSLPHAHMPTKRPLPVTIFDLIKQSYETFGFITNETIERMRNAAR